MTEKKLIIFDLDGTLVDAYAAIIRSFNFAMQELNYPKQDALTIRRAVGWGDENLLKPFVQPKDLKKALSIYRKHHRRALMAYSRLLPGARQLLRYLKIKGYKVAVASNRPTKFSSIIIRHLGLEQYFDFCLCADTLKRGKPNPEILNRIMHRFSLAKRQTLYVGDMCIDAQTGRRAGIETVIVTTGSNTRAEIDKEKPCLVIKRIQELRKRL